MEIHADIDERKFMIVLFLIICISALGIVVAYGGTSPSTVGHTWGEMICDKCINSANLNDSSVTGAKIGCDSTLCMNPVNGNVGIGTVAPAAKLEVAGTAKITGGLLPDYDSGWFAVANYNTYTKAHGLGVAPSTVFVFAADSGTPTAWYIPNTEDSDGYTNRGYSVKIDGTNIYLYCVGGYRRLGTTSNWAYAKIIAYK